MKTKALIVALGLLALGACATQTLPPGGQVTESVITACSSYSAVLSALTPFKPRLSAGDVVTVNLKFKNSGEVITRIPVKICD